MSIRSQAEVSQAYDAGRSWLGYMRRGGPAMTAGVWTDMSYAAGIPVANYYASAPLVSAVLSPNEGILHGPPVNAAGFKKYLHRVCLLPVTAIGQAVFYVHDIVAVYPFVDGDGGEQLMTNELPSIRYGGVGCKIMLVSQGAGVTNSTDTIINYTDPDGSGRVWQGWTNNTSLPGQIISGPADGVSTGVAHGSPYIINQGARGVARIDSINQLTGAGGIYAACIVKPLGTVSMQINETTPIEVDFFADKLTRQEIEDGAYIHMAGRSSASATPATLHAELAFVWG